MVTIVSIISYALWIYSLIIFLAAALSWLIVLNIVSTDNPAIASLRNILAMLTEPVLRPIRAFIPPVNGFDLSPVVVLVVIWLIQMFILPIFWRMAYGV